MTKPTSSTNLPFNPKPSTIMHIDINSCFATIEQQANPYLRGKPIAVAAYPSPNGCILAASVEAKRLGIKTGMRVKDGQLLYPKLIVMGPDPDKYRDVHLKLRSLLNTYTNIAIPKSIDEFVLDLEGCPAQKVGLWETAREIKTRIKTEVGEYITVSVGIAPNYFLAKTASGLHKPDGLDEINLGNYLEVYERLGLTDLCGIKEHSAARLRSFGINTLMDFYTADAPALKQAFHSVVGYYWYLRLRGWEIDDVDFGRKSFGNSYVLPKAATTMAELSPILFKLVEKTAYRLRKNGFKAGGVHVAVKYRDGTHWHHGHSVKKLLFDERDIFREMCLILGHSPYRLPVSMLAESVFDLTGDGVSQLELFDNVARKEDLNRALDRITGKWGDFVITPARMVGTGKYVPDRIAFGGVKELYYGQS